jgi:chemotaxis protein MotB
MMLALAMLAFVVIRLYLPAQEALTKSEDELAAAREQAAVLQRSVDTLEGLHKDLAARVAQRESEVQALQAAQEELAAKLDAEIREGDVAISQSRGELIVDLIDKVLFDSGEAELNEKGVEVLRRVGETFLKIPDKLIQVTGHTDTVPISDKLVEKFPTNWELSSHRATNVVRFLEEQVKIPGSRLAAVGRSQYKPIASNSTARGRRRNRRIEVTLLPRARK